MRVPFRVLAIETSCDDTAVAIVSSCRRILSNVIIQQHKQHSVHGGIVPQLAAHLHRQHLPLAIQRCIKDAGLGDSLLATQNISAIAATRGPGLGACLSAGYESARCIAAASNIPFYGIHHMVHRFGAAAVATFLGRTCFDSSARKPKRPLSVLGTAD